MKVWAVVRYIGDHKFLSRVVDISDMIREYIIKYIRKMVMSMGKGSAKYVNEPEIYVRVENKMKQRQ